MQISSPSFIRISIGRTGYSSPFRKPNSFLNKIFCCWLFNSESERGWGSPGRSTSQLNCALKIAATHPKVITPFSCGSGIVCTAKECTVKDSGCWITITSLFCCQPLFDRCLYCYGQKRQYTIPDAWQRGGGKRSLYSCSSISIRLACKLKNVKRVFNSKPFRAVGSAGPSFDGPSNFQMIVKLIQWIRPSVCVSVSHHEENQKKKNNAGWVPSCSGSRCGLRWVVWDDILSSMREHHI